MTHALIWGLCAIIGVLMFVIGVILLSDYEFRIGNPKFAHILTYLWVLLLSTFGGLASFARRIKSGEAIVHPVRDLFVDLLISGFVGLLSFWLTIYGSIDYPLNAVLIGVSAHMGTRGLIFMEHLVETRLRALMESRK